MTPAAGLFREREDPGLKLLRVRLTDNEQLQQIEQSVMKKERTWNLG